MGCCPKCGYAVMKRGVNAVTGSLAVGLAAAVATGGVLGSARKTTKCGAAEPSSCRANRRGDLGVRREVRRPGPVAQASQRARLRVLRRQER